VSVHEATIALAEYQAIEAWTTGTPQKRWGFNRFTPTTRWVFIAASKAGSASPS